MRLFAYGTLQFPDVMQRVSGSHYGGVPAVLEGYACFTVRDRLFPGIIPQPGALTRGLLYNGLGLAQLERIDAFESDFYQRERVMVSDSHDRPCQAWAYVMRPECHGLLDTQPWDKDWFARLHLRDYLQGIR